LKFIRKALLPAVIAAGFLGFLGMTGGVSTPTVSAADGDVCKVDGPLNISVGVKAYYTAVVENKPDGKIDVDLNDQVGNSDITSLNDSTIPNTNFLDDVTLKSGANVCGTTDAALYAKTLADNKTAFQQSIVNGIDNGGVCSGVPPVGVVACDDGGAWNDNDIDCGLVNVLGDLCSISPSIINAVVDALAKARADGKPCADMDNIAEDTAILAGATEFVAAQFNDYFDAQSRCSLGSAAPTGPDGYITVDVTCYKPGFFDLSFSSSGKAAQITVQCHDDVVSAEIFAFPASVEINPSLANVAHSLIFVVLKGRDGEIAYPGTKVTFLTDRCAIESSGVENDANFRSAEGLFRVSLNALNPATAYNVENSSFALTTAPDGASRQQEETLSFITTSTSAATDFAQRTVAATILHCDPIHAPGVTPGPAVITAIIDRGSINNYLNADNDDLVVRTTVTVVGPPAANGVTVTAAPSTLACGEKATITADVKDAIGQPVSDHTWVEAVTNHGGVLAGTGAVAGQQGLVSPVSSTVAETFGGKATFYLLTSTAHVGAYEVVVTTGGGGGVTGQLVNGGVTTNLLGGLFTTAPISVQVTVNCTVAAAAPAPAPTSTAPRTGQGITPPSTGDAGLASTQTSTAAGAIAAVVAALVVAGFAVKLVREE
jgi:hypothetical protein